MTQFELIPHPDYPPSRVAAVIVHMARADQAAVHLTYYVQNAWDLVNPSKQPSGRTDGLWRTTCFELFLMRDDDERYAEFNFSPSTQWAAYAFDRYRDGMVELPSAPPEFTPRPTGVGVTLDLTGFPLGRLRMALAAVIEEKGGVKSYWSLAHPPGPPDFHHPACFTAMLPPLGRP